MVSNLKIIDSRDIFVTEGAIQKCLFTRAGASPGHPVQGLAAYSTYALHPRRVCLVLCVFVGDICARMRRRATPTNTVA